MENQQTERILDFPPERQVVLLSLGLFTRHLMYALLEVDVTHARHILDEYKLRTGERLSFTGYLAWCTAHTVALDTKVQAYRKGRNRLAVADNVDVGMMIERRVGEGHAPVGYVLRGANQKSFLQIHNEIRAAQERAAQPPQPARKRSAEGLAMALRLPWLVRPLFMRVVRWMIWRDPARYTSAAGTVGITAVGMFGKGQGGWGIAPTMHSLCVIVGSTAWKPAVVAGKVEPREILNLTVSFDHDVVDGGPAARFARALVETIEGGAGLDEVERPLVAQPHGQGAAV